MMNEVLSEKGQFDVAICGGGLAGLTLARQLKLEKPEISIALVDKFTRPLPEAIFKVGESLVETGSFYLMETLGLTEYLKEKHFRKLGFRFFFGDSKKPFQERPEFGLAQFPAVNSFQIDRGILENDLRTFDEEAGITMLEGYSVKDVVLSGNGGKHEVCIQRVADKQERVIKARWLVDAMGRRRFIQKKLNLKKKLGEKCSSAWFRIKGRVDIDDWVPCEEQAWHDRVPGKIRYYSTNHLMGTGYWVWLIPLPSGNTSIGIVVQEDFHPFETFNTFDRAMQWLRDHEPVLAGQIADREHLDFRVMRQYSYTSHQVLSSQRWACVGESAVFPDPFYALGTELIAITNSIITEMIKLDLSGRLTDQQVEQYDKFVLSLTHWLTKNIQVAYPIMGSAAVMACKIMWDTAGGWSALGPRMFNGIFLDEEGHTKFRRASGRFFFLTGAMQKFFVDWAAKTQGRCTYQFLDFLKLPLMKQMQMRNLQSGKSVQRTLDDQLINMQKLEEFAQAIFLIAVEDVYPEHLDRFKPPTWLNAWAISMNPERWESDGLFRPTTPSREVDLEQTWKELRDFFSFEGELEKVAV